MIKNLLLSCILVLTTLSLAHAVVDVSMSVVPSYPLTINVTFTNPTKESITLLNRFTPLEGVRSNMFVIQDQRGGGGGGLVPYTGMVVRRGEVPLKEEYTTVDAGMQVWVTVDLWTNYDFTQPGYYTILLVLPETVGECDQKLEAFVSSPSPSAPSVGAYTNCGSTQISQIEAAVTTSISQSGRAYNCMYGRTCDTLMTRWFGTFSSSNYNYDLNVFRSVSSRLSNYPFNAYCNPAGCGSNVYGYVYPTDSTFTVYLCGLFWSIPNERVNTIIHEMSHFSSLGGTQDYAYGKTNCLNLARSNPTRASRNADNVCYFAEEA